MLKRKYQIIYHNVTDGDFKKISWLDNGEYETYEEAYKAAVTAIKDLNEQGMLWLTFDIFMHTGKWEATK